MSYTALYRKWRPKVFEDLIGQKAIVDTLRNQIEHGKFGHAYIFSGTRGTGKTSTAKILARAINCPERTDHNPCNKCEICQSILDETLMDVIEMDAASNNGVDDIRELRENVKYPPSRSKFKVYIIDEVHMLSTSAFNALLKTLEEPPDYAVFILATTEPHKIPATILSRCQQFEFKRVGKDDLMERMNLICESQGMSCEPKALDKLINRADGAVRDALGLLDRCLTSTSQILKAEDVDQILGLIGVDFLMDLIDHIGRRDRRSVLNSLNQLSESGANLQAFTRDLILAFRDVMVTAAAPDHPGMLKFSGLLPERVIAQAKMFGMNGAVKLLEALTAIETQIKYAQNPLIFLETGLLKAMTPGSVGAAEAVERLEKLENELALLKRLIKNGEMVSVNQPQTLADESPDYLANKSIVSVSGVPDNEIGFKFGLKEEAVQESENVQKSSNRASDSGTRNAINVDPEKVLRLWPEILTYLQKNNGRVYAFLVDGTPLKFEKGHLVVGFKADQELHIKKLKEEANHKVVEEAFESVLGAAVGFVLEVINEANQQKKGPSTEDRIRELLGDMADLLEIQD
ncbi:DNA polymerase III subunit gamma/tau [Acidaminobacter hydrogenoformans]|uniref:DNA-directed DNA polymerase n=1 Tax=Acidaminobacter hydrogenoformans DSM 2784 TaxID=1120920 RepID=A0A1G5RRE6_9FIRM|nr:DNA polymerase III subunit gamma/tau [Acidaminobacter hydrogenoformans]SCZ76653.1 DNA polymerase-3 subunit gamma/tau [Acidaminobacter hydrogenoformans DSM 2784]